MTATNMIRIVLVCLCFVLSSQSAHGDGKHQVFSLGSFEFESGVTVENTILSYVTHGKLNDARSNAVLVPSWYSGDHHGYDYLIGKDKALDPEKYFIVATDMFANGLSSSPSNTSPPHDGPRFPEVSIRDNVRATKQLLVEEFGIERLVAVVGFSMGAQQALQWAVSYPDDVEHVVAYCGNAKEYPFGYVRLEGAISALTADSAWMNGDYETPPEVGLKALARHWAAWGASQEWWRQELYKTWGASTIEEALVEQEAYILSLDANDLLWQAKKWQRHNVGYTPGFDGDFERALASIKAKVLLMPSSTDLYFPVADARYESQLIPNAKLKVIASIWGHDVFNDSKAVEFLNAQILEFLNGTVPGQ